MDFKNFKKHFQYLIIKGLKPLKRNITSKGQILISKKLFNKLRSDYGLTGRFKINERFHTDLNLELCRYSDRCQYCQCKSDTFRIRVGRQKPAFAFNHVRPNEFRKFSSGAFIFAFEFIRYEYTQSVHFISSID